MTNEHFSGMRQTSAAPLSFTLYSISTRNDQPLALTDPALRRWNVQRSFRSSGKMLCPRPLHSFLRSLSVQELLHYYGERPIY